MRIRSFIASFLAAGLLAVAGGASAQLVNYSEALGAYKDSKEAGVKLVDGVTPGVTAKARVARVVSAAGRRAR